jgi:hypothetical protein
MGLDLFPGRHHPVVEEQDLRLARGWFLQVGGSAGTIREPSLYWTQLVILK